MEPQVKNQTAQTVLQPYMNRGVMDHYRLAFPVPYAPSRVGRAQTRAKDRRLLYLVPCIQEIVNMIAVVLAELRSGLEHVETLQTSIEWRPKKDCGRADDKRTLEKSIESMPLLHQNQNYRAHSQLGPVGAAEAQNHHQ